MKKILVVEDEQTLREGIVIAFKDRGWQVDFAECVPAATKLLEEQIYDVVVTDYKMPEGNGMDVLKRCRMLNEGTVVPRGQRALPAG